MSNTLKQTARLTADALPAYRAYRGHVTARELANERRDPQTRDWLYAGRIITDIATDGLDGLLARYAGPTWYGGWLDQLADKAWFLQIANQLAKNGEIHNLNYRVTRARDAGTLALRAVAEPFGINTDADKWGKAKMRLQSAAVVAACSPIAANLPEVVNGLFVASTAASVASGAEMLVGYADQIQNRFDDKVANFIVAQSVAIADLALAV